MVVQGSFQLCAQEITNGDRLKMRKDLKKMSDDDEYYRHIIATENNREKTDSLWKLQAINDSINKVRLLDLIRRYGYPSFDRTGVKCTEEMTVHFTNERDSLELYAVFESEMKKGNMPPEEFARWYDRWRINKKQTTWYGVYGAGSPKKEELLLINKRRRAIGLPDLKP